MSPRVTAIIVARNGAEHLPRTLEALAAQTMAPDAIIAVDCGSTDDTGALLAEFGPTHLIAADSDLTFGGAIATAVRVTTPPTAPNELLWLIAQDTAPEPTALAELVAALETAPSVAIAGPKLLDWERGEFIRSLGESLTTQGATVALVSDELDQGQRDVLSDVLAVVASGMLVRHTVWETLGGFDPGLPVVDDALDFCVRARLAGHRVSVAPAARVATAGDGVAGANTSHKGRIRRRRARQQRTAQLHRRLAYAPAVLVPVHWLSLVPLAILRSIIALLGKQPGRIGGEFAAAFTAAFSGIRTTAARRNIARTRSNPWSVLGSLRVTPAEMRRRRALAREARIARARGARHEIGFLTSGGAWTVLAAVVVGLVVAAPLVGSAAVGGGGLLPLSSTPAELWQNIGYGWRDLGPGFVGAADPFAAVLAVLGSLAFWSPSAAMLALWVAAVPLAALGAWFAATRLTDRGGLRAIAAVLWMLAPTFMTAIADGRPAAVLTHLLLPWLVFAGFAAARSWSASATTALLFAAIVACAPSLTPALLVIWLVLLVISGRGFFRIIGIPIPAVALLAPLVFDQALRANWIALVADPGVPLAGTPASVWQLLLGFPGGGFGGWDQALGLIPIDGLLPQVVVPILLAPLAVLGLLALFLPGFRSAAFALGVSLLGFATALAATLIVVATTGSQLVPVWAGTGLSLYWLGIVGAVTIGLNAIPRYSIIPAIVAAACFVAVAAPLALAVPLGQSAVDATSNRILPAFVSAESAGDPRAGTLAIVPQPDGGILADLQRGSGTTLDDQSVLASTDREVSAAQKEIATIAGNLTSRSAFDAAAALDANRIRFVLLEPAVRADGAAPSAAAVQVTRRATAALDGNSTLVPVGRTDYGMLWRVDTNEDGAASAAVPANAGGWIGTASLIVAAVVFGATLLLSIPTGVGRELPPESARRRAARERRERRAGRSPRRAAAGVVIADEDLPEDGVTEESTGDAGAAAEAVEAGEADADAATSGTDGTTASPADSGAVEGDAEPDPVPDPEAEARSDSDPEPSDLTEPTESTEEKRDVE
ncbi:glycosyltransferase [Leifsonia sp. YIM 134122]|uniref:Glycosyltransferase n=1 Tax=Leifsonia stereocauli TaxID=3134136 RepID=A0ABU9W3G4_9MICO